MTSVPPAATTSVTPPTAAPSAGWSESRRPTFLIRSARPSTSPHITRTLRISSTKSATRLTNNPSHSIFLPPPPPPLRSPSSPARARFSLHLRNTSVLYRCTARLLHLPSSPSRPSSRLR